MTLFAGVLVAFLEDWVFRSLYSFVLKCFHSSVEINNKFVFLEIKYDCINPSKSEIMKILIILNLIASLYQWLYYLNLVLFM